ARPWSRRSVLRGAALGAAGVTAAALVGCGGEDDTDAREASTAATGSGAGATSTATNGPAGEVRIAPGRYDGTIPPTAAEADPLTHGRYGGTLLTRYLDPPHMDFNRTLSCTINTTHDYVKNKLTRAKLGASANIVSIDIEP